MTHDDWHILQRHATAAVAAANDEVLYEGEVGWETDTRRCKLGDGVTAWNDLPYASDTAADVDAVEAALAAEIVVRETADENLQEQVDAASQELAFADVSFVGGTTAGINNTPVMVEGPYTIVPPSDRPQVVNFSLVWNITVVGNGTFTIQLYEWTGGTATLRSYNQEWVSASRPVTSSGNRLKGEKRLDPHTDWKVFQVYFTMSRDVGSSLQMGVPALGNEYSRPNCQLVQL